MTYYIYIENGELNGSGTAPNLTEGTENLEVDKELYNAYAKDSEKYIYLDGQIVENTNYEQEKALKERERLDKLSLTAADVERAIYKAKGMDFEDVIAEVKTLKQVQGDNLDFDLKALKIELKANNFYRGNPYINQIGTLLGFSQTQLDKFFETGNYLFLLLNEDEFDDEIPF